jgi:hypothetical protein
VVGLTAVTAAFDPLRFSFSTSPATNTADPSRLAATLRLTPPLFT